jgi:hypothetical protein
MNDRDIRKLLLAARRGPYSSVVADLVPGWDYAKLSSVIGYCSGRGYVEAITVTHGQSPHPEFILGEVTAEGEDYLRDASLWTRMQQLGWKLPAAVVLAISLLSNLVTIVGSDKTPTLYHSLLDKVRHLLH